jgi:prevent-host-death family protein
VSTISVSELKKQPAKKWLKSASKDDLIITSNGEPVAVLLSVDPASVQSTQALVRSVRALQAQKALQDTAILNGTSELSLAEINSEISAARRARRRK